MSRRHWLREGAFVRHSGLVFPGWLVCLAVALLLTVLVRFLLLRLKVELPAPIVVYPSLLACLTFAQWLLFLQ